eukprot:9304688-Pyramimonas_sp.AAC.1
MVLRVHDGPGMAPRPRGSHDDPWRAAISRQEHPNMSPKCCSWGHIGVHATKAKIPRKLRRAAILIS